MVADTVAEADEDIAGEAAEPLGGLPLTLMGQNLTVIKGRKDVKWSYENRLQLKCPRHDNCQISRSVALERLRFGDKAPLVFLGTWLSSAWMMTPEVHKKFKPSIAQQTEWLKDHPDLT